MLLISYSNNSMHAYQAEHGPRTQQLDDKYSLDVAPDGGETRAALQLRAQNFMLQLVRQHRGSAVLVVTHGAFMQETVNCLAGVTGQVRRKNCHMQAKQCGHVSACGNACKLINARG